MHDIEGNGKKNSAFRQKAEELVEKRRRSGGLPISQMDPQEAFLELEITRVELELRQNDLVHRERQLSEALDLNRKILNNSQVGILAYRADSGDCIFANPAAAKLTNGTIDQLLSQNFRQLKSWKESQLLELAEKALRDSKPTQGEIHGVSSFGRELWLDAVFTSFLSNDVLHLLLMGRDITERKKTEIALKKSEERYTMLLENLNTGFFRANLDGRLLEANHATVKMAGYDDLTEFLGIPTPMRYADNADREHLFKELYAKGFAKGLEMRSVKKDGSLFWIDLSAVLIKDENGNPNSMLGIIEDITARKSAEEALRESEEKYRTLVETSPDAIALNDMSGNFLAANGQFCRFFGFKNLDEIRSLEVNSRSLVFEEDLPVLQQSMEPLMAKGFVSDVVMRVYRKDGTVFPASFSVALSRNQAGEPLAILTVIRDITEIRNAENERKRLEAQVMASQKLESLGVLAGGIAHDFNNLLMVILGNADLALHELSPNSPVRSLLNEIDIVTHRAADLCHQMLAYSGKGNFVVKPMNLSEAVEEMGHMLAVAISKKAILSYNLSNRLSLIDGDGSQIRQIIMNLIINASEALGEAGGVISISTGLMKCDKKTLDEAVWRENLSEGDFVYLEVADSGCGMDPETLRNIFDPFFTTKFAGRGLGLAAVQGIVRGHRGIINVQSTPGKGTAFRVAFPFSTAKSPSEQAPSAGEVAWTGSGGVLVVDDEEPVRETCRHLIEFLGFEVFVASDGSQAVEVFRKHHEKIRCVLLDLTMPHMDGEEAFREMVKIDPEVRVVLHSGYGEQEIRERFKDRGKLVFMPKPYTIDDLATALKTCIGE